MNILKRWNTLDTQNYVSDQRETHNMPALMNVFYGHRHTQGFGGVRKDRHWTNGLPVHWKEMDLSYLSYFFFFFFLFLQWSLPFNMYSIFRYPKKTCILYSRGFLHFWPNSQSQESQSCKEFQLSSTQKTSVFIFSLVKLLNNTACPNILKIGELLGSEFSFLMNGLWIFILHNIMSFV